MLLNKKQFVWVLTIISVIIIFVIWLFYLKDIVFAPRETSSNLNIMGSEFKKWLDETKKTQKQLESELKKTLDLSSISSPTSTAIDILKEKIIEESKSIEN